ncbi:hypothetical protein EZV62_006377 [Acer yangbiense]|uniref:Heparan-alpha-glucosaminide N-acetyltransferase catalytic domain-containing protein n=1 Tax=Acer yangbiense TaxID=1000413 RepID=A0A5C7I8Z3_9ROSI|nr:hypothetical protein EZV62_006377 [Acer yangbiense]
MAEIKAETSHHHYPFIISDSINISDQEKKHQRPKRVASLDIFRGLTVAVTGLEYRIEAVKKVILRTLKLLFWDILLQGGYSHAPDKLTYGVDVKMIRWCGILQALLYGTYVLDWQFTIHNKDSVDYGKVFNVTCGVKGKLDPPCNAVGYIDREACTQDSPYEGPLWNDAPSWCHASFEPEGILSSISAILSTIIIVHFGRAYKFEAWEHELFKTFLFLNLLSIRAFESYFLFSLASIPLNKQLYTFSYVCVTSGAAALVFSAIYALVDIWDLKYMFLPLEWIGMNAMLVYVMAAEGIFAGFINGWYYDDPHNTLVCFLVMLYTHIALKCKNNIRTNFYSLAPMSNQDE